MAGSVKVCIIVSLLTLVALASGTCTSQQDLADVTQFLQLKLLLNDGSNRSQTSVESLAPWGMDVYTDPLSPLYGYNAGAEPWMRLYGYNGGQDGKPPGPPPRKISWILMPLLSLALFDYEILHGKAKWSIPEPNGRTQVPAAQASFWRRNRKVAMNGGVVDIIQVIRESWNFDVVSNANNWDALDHIRADQQMRAISDLVQQLLMDKSRELMNIQRPAGNDAIYHAAVEQGAQKQVRAISPDSRDLVRQQAPPIEQGADIAEAPLAVNPEAEAPPGGNAGQNGARPIAEPEDGCCEGCRCTIS